MQLKRKAFEYGILAMGIGCALVFCLMFLNFVSFIIDFIQKLDPVLVYRILESIFDSGNYLEIFLIFIWGFFFTGVFLVICSLLIQLISNVFFRSNLLSEVPKEIELDPDKIAIVIPAYNEGKTIKKVITECKEYAHEIVVIDDGSDDETPEILSEFSDIHVITNRTNLGLGKTMKRGIEYATELNIDVIVTFDADGQYRASEIPKIAYPVLSENVDLVLGSRFAGNIEKMPFSKKLGNRIMSFALSILLGLRITDGQTGFRGISKDLALSFRLRGEYTYTQEMIIQSRFLKKKIIEVPIFFDKRISGESRLIRSPIDYALKSWLTILRTLRDFQPIWFFGGAGVISFLSGLFFLSMTVISYAVPWRLHISNPFELAIFSAVLMLLGIQFVFFGFLADAQRTD